VAVKKKSANKRAALVAIKFCAKQCAGWGFGPAEYKKCMKACTPEFKKFARAGWAPK